MHYTRENPVKVCLQTLVMVEYIEEGNKTLAIIVYSEDETDGISFFTPENYSQQLGLMNRPQGHEVEPHRHPERERVIERTDEVLFIRDGRVKITIFGDEAEKEVVLTDGDVVLLSSGHSVEMLEESEIVAVKQGPYREDEKEEL
jgi:mannose-6-phosphate isomerase-like protein (cupin superfamily)